MTEINSMNKIISSSLLIILTAALLFSCRKDINKIGVDVVGENPLVVLKMDTVTIQVNSELIDTLRTDELTSHVLGAYNDPVFGKLNASLYSEFTLEREYDNSPFQGDNPVFDSIVLYVKYSNTDIYGDKNHALNLTVYELGDTIARESIYYSFHDKRIKDSEPLAELNFIPDFDSIDYYTKPASPEDMDTIRILKPIHIRLSDDFGARLFQDTAIFNTTEDFKEAFKGIFITTLDENFPSGEGVVVNTTFDNEETFIGIYYHNDDSLFIQDNDTSIYNHMIKLETNFSTAHFSNFNHYDYVDAAPEFLNEINDTALATTGINNFYLQGLGGVRTTITFPYLDKIETPENYAINEAKLFIHEVSDKTLYPNFAPIPSITLSHEITVDSVSGYSLISDARGGDQYFSGVYLEEDEKYFFRVTEYVQDLIKGEMDDNELRMEIIGGDIRANRLIGGGENPFGMEDKKISLEIIYTKIDGKEE